MVTTPHRLISRNSQGIVSLEVKNASNSPTLSMLCVNDERYMAWFYRHSVESMDEVY